MSAQPVGVTPFPRKYTTFLEPDVTLITHIEKLLEQAKRGELRAIAEACVYRDDLEISAGTDAGWCKSPGTGTALGYAIAQLQHRYFATMDMPE